MKIILIRIFIIMGIVFSVANAYNVDYRPIALAVGLSLIVIDFLNRLTSESK